MMSLFLLITIIRTKAARYKEQHRASMQHGQVGPQRPREEAVCKKTLGDDCPERLSGYHSTAESNCTSRTTNKTTLLALTACLKLNALKSTLEKMDSILEDDRNIYQPDGLGCTT
ncbi:hypothetical protein DPMN_155671 [Dreissena polymorpha]|uniref:Uncharacterized protein n=1 Tax=Dreissena polymorpha TaxID=45954 RepID=A0A9D4FT05_DREPO|nr:hypothetical protein DPMN_155671 [Dreissena polymorpha]